MGCIIAILVLAFPRVTLVLMWLFTNYLNRAYHGIILPVLGFIFLPLTTIVYAWLVNSHLPIDGIYLVFLILAVIFDVGSWGGGHYSRKHR